MGDLDWNNGSRNFHTFMRRFRPIFGYGNFGCFKGYPTAHVEMGVAAHTGANTPPKFGDFECQRHWMEITYHLPSYDWCVRVSRRLY